MELNAIKFNQTVEAAKAKTDNKRWISAIDKAADALLNGKWVVTELFSCVAITTESGKTYWANGICQCDAFFHNQPCKHRAAARLIELYNEEIMTEKIADDILVGQIGDEEWPEEPGDEQCLTTFEQIEQAPLVKPTGPCVIEIMPNGDHWRV